MVVDKPIIRPSSKTDFSFIKAALRSRGLVTVCEEAQCPNMAECWHETGTATFMVMGDTCTRGCKFCAVKTARKGVPLDPHEPQKLSEAISIMHLDYIVITSVDRDDLPDQGAGHFAQCIARIRKDHPQCCIEVLIPDFRGELDCIKTITEARPDVIAHNLETVRSLQSKVRDPRANYEQSLRVLRVVKRLDPLIFTKSSLMLGLGETESEVEQAMLDLRAAGCDMLTLGQYLKPREKPLAVVEYVSQLKFDSYKSAGEKKGFAYVASGPFVRSSYRAGELFVKSVKTRCHDAQKSHPAVSC